MVEGFSLVEMKLLFSEIGVEMTELGAAEFQRLVREVGDVEMAFDRHLKAAKRTTDS